jgi:DNA-directed RNA polymerase subunit RPC12/RpoP
MANYRVYRFTVANVKLDTVARLFGAARQPATLTEGVGVYKKPCPTCGAEFDEPYIDQVQALSDDNFERCPECGSEVHGSGWGIEPTVTIESAVSTLTDTARDLFDLVCGILADHGETCAYLTRNGGSPRLLYADGRIERINENEPKG